MFKDEVSIGKRPSQAAKYLLLIMRTRIQATKVMKNCETRKSFFKKMFIYTIFTLPQPLSPKKVSEGDIYLLTPELGQT